MNFNLVRQGVDVVPLLAEIEAHPELWGQQTARLGVGSPHAQSTDIWVRYRDLDAYRDQHGLDMRAFCDEHESVWLEPSAYLPSALLIAREIAGGDERLGGVLLTRLPAGGVIAPHVDGGWHAAAHEKFYVAVKVRTGAVFGFPDGDLRASDGDVWHFRNDVPHWVVNDSPEDRISMIVCVKKEAP